ncbi:MAG: alanine--tRNA ligase [Candidatus Omnitrophica bacterium]|nr:alanine--tRNA ligase [Candidatus Omnitrophota bacterium]
MLGNFSFGDYFKEEAISWAWEFLTQELKIDPEKLWVSVYKDDHEAYGIWKNEVGIPVERIVKLGDKENFWPSEAKSKGPNGPCGPCSEIFYDFGSSIGCAKNDCTPACSCGRFVEVWNLVFTQYNRKEDGSLEPLPNKNIDTGMGLERLAAVTEGKLNNFETDLFHPIVKEIAAGCRLKALGNRELNYAIADHIRSVVFSIYDGIMPSNESRGYIVRKIIRKAILHLRELGIKQPFLNKLVPIVAEIMKQPYPDLMAQQEAIAGIILKEEKTFIDTLNSSDSLFQEKFVKLLHNQDEELAGKIVFQLYDTYGIPLELTKIWLEKRNIKFTQSVFERELREQKERSRAQSAMKGDVFSAKGLDIKVKDSKFVGYQENSLEARVLAILKDGEIILDQTPFYAESGGQVGDAGKLVSGKNVFKVLDTQKIDNVILHIGKVVSGTFKEGDKVTAGIDTKRRLNIARNHTATHILQAALRKVLGTHVQQQGSLVAEDRFRFDFTHFKGLSEEEISQVEEVANSYISKSQVVNCKEMSLKEAKKAGALAFFEEKYRENVRVVSIGDISKELCGGTHLDNISKIGLIKIISEGSVASGIRRIEGTTGGFAEQFIKDEQEKAIEESKKRDKLKELKEQEKKRSLEVNKSLRDVIPRIIDKGIKINGINVVSSFEAGLDMNALRLLVDKVNENLNQGVIALGSQDNEHKKAYLVIAVTQDLLSKGLNAQVLIRQIAPIIGGSGGGRPDFAQSGGTKPEEFPKAFNELKRIIKDI